MATLPSNMTSTFSANTSKRQPRSGRSSLLTPVTPSNSEPTLPGPKNAKPATLTRKNTPLSPKPVQQPPQLRQEPVKVPLSEPGMASLYTPIKAGEPVTAAAATATLSMAYKPHLPNSAEPDISVRLVFDRFIRAIAEGQLKPVYSEEIIHYLSTLSTIHPQMFSNFVMTLTNDQLVMMNSFYTQLSQTLRASGQGETRLVGNPNNAANPGKS